MQRLCKASTRPAKGATQHGLGGILLAAGSFVLGLLGREVLTCLRGNKMLQAVHVIHEEKIVHSDLKPANFVLVRGQLKLIDFGIANAIANDTTNIQRDHQVCRHADLSVATPFADARFCRSIDRYRELHVPRNYRAPRWHAAPQSRQAK
jgi:serine/threonine protein kinase